MKRRMRLFGALALAVSARCASLPETTDTGFAGTWARSGTIGEYRSTVSIVRQGDAWLFRWKVDTADGTWKVRCGWDGRCDEFVDAEKVAEYTFKATQGPGEDFLTVECERKGLRQADSGYRYVDELVLEPGGRRMTAYTMELDGQTFSRESTRQLVLDKVSDAVADPPKGVRP